ncbi:PhoH family protein [Pajaroellobacter abortibovis]|uniref:PhoH-like protein n=1 Tax=Pajaroellobacter abortibovis TaxID=1882918 RepID=A0A1L6MZ43_9BACT|nr:PhoH family protein [Pajaroellobacter abortibovis]APS00813.1 phosphate starvation-inducible protein PhoH [Pajaroellobacter abortibovis]
MVSSKVEVEETSVLVNLTGPSHEKLKLLEKEGGVAIGLRGNTIFLHGDKVNVSKIERFVREAICFIQHGGKLDAEEILRAMRQMKEKPERPFDLREEKLVIGSGRRPVLARGAAQCQYIDAIHSHTLTFCVGVAGTGKTYLAMACAMAAFHKQTIKKIILTRPAVEAGEKLGFLPGDLAEKVNPYLRPLYDALNDMVDFERGQELIRKGYIEIAPLAFMRGRTLNDSFIILDEAQNTTPEQMRMFLTRLGHHSKAIVTGDMTQIDLPSGKSSGLVEAYELLKGIEGIAFCYFREKDIMRHPLVKKIVIAYEAQDRE